MSGFKDMVKRDAKNVFLNTDQFAENIVYIDRSGGQKSMAAIIDRQQLSPLAEDSNRVVVDRATIQISTDPDLGKQYVHKKEEFVLIPDEYGNAVVKMRVVDILECDAGMWHLDCQK